MKKEFMLVQNVEAKKQSGKVSEMGKSNTCVSLVYHGFN
jgi:hypothetical protein